MATSGEKRKGFTVVEMIMTMLILGITSMIALDFIANADAGLRAERAARDTVALMRFARTRAMCDGVTYKVRFDVANKTISAIDPNNSNAVLAGPMAGSVMQVNLSGRSDVSNVTMTPALAGDSTDPYDVAFSSLGNTSNTGTVTFTYGPLSKVLLIYNVGDPIIQGDSRKP